MADISKLKLSNGTIVDLKDKAGRGQFATLLGDNVLAALKAAAWRDVAAAISDGDGKIADAATVKAYVDAQVGSIHKFDIVVCAAKASEIPAGAKYKDDKTEITGTMAAADSTMYKIYLVKNDTAGAGNYVEWLTIREGAEGSYTYSWEAIGNTSADLANYVRKTTKIADVEIGEGITTSDLITALGLNSFAFIDSATGSTTLDTIESITMNDVTVAGNAAVTTTATAATLAKAAYTPSGSITGSAISGGSINVTVKDAAAGTAVSDITYESYTPAGTIAAVAEGGSFAALKSATFGEDAENGVQIAGTVSKPAVDLTSSSQDVLTGVKTAGTLPSFTEGTFTAASIDAAKFFSAGTLPTKAADTFTAGSFTKGTAVVAATEGIVASIDETDSEMLVFTAAATDNVMDHDATFVAPSFTEGTFSQGTLPSIDVANGFSGGSKAADTWNAGAMPTFNDGSVNNVTAAALHETPVFTGNKYKVTTTDDTALKSVEFTGTAADVKFKGAKYLKQEIDAQTFTPTAATLGFSGTKIDDFQVTGVTYDKADATAAFSETVTPSTKTLTKTPKTITVTVSAPTV